MKKIIIAMAAVAAAFTMASCNKEQLTESEGTPVVGNDIITAYTESALTKTSLDGDDTNGYDVVWSEGDKIKIGGNEFTLIEGANSTTGRFQGTLPTEDGTYTACYPADYNGTDWPASQTYTADNITGSPMKASVTVSGGKVIEESLSFKNAGGILRLTLKGIAKVGYIKVSANGLDEIVLNCGSGVSLDADGKVFHIAMPKGNYSGVSIAVWTTDYDGCTKKLKEGTNLVINKSEITPASFTASFPSPTPVASLPDAFSIADGKQICFSRGNLRYTVASKEWSFYDKQYKCGPLHEVDSKEISLFTWGYNATQSINPIGSASNNVSITSGNLSPAQDWGSVFGESSPWRTLTSAEWAYLFEERTDAANKYGYATVGGQKGLIILPDVFIDPMKNGGSSAFKPQSSTASNWTDNYYTLAGNWEAMEAAGAVFLPAAGRRGGNSIATGSNEQGHYWSSSAADSDKAYFVYFNDNSFAPAYSWSRGAGCSVRLVTNHTSCTVKFDMNGHGTALRSLTGIAFGSKITKPADPAASNCIFVGWFKDKDCTTLWNFDSDVVTTDIILYAKWMELPDGVLSGKFSVSDTKKVLFSKGNLYYDGSALNFEASQYATPSSWDASHVSHFTWSSTVAAAVGESNDGGNLFCDEKHHKVAVNGSEAIYYALSTEEWQYLFQNHSYKWAAVNGVNGYVIAPDGFARTLADTYADDAALAADNLVFLPAAGARDGSSVSNVGDGGFYWSSTSYSEFDVFVVLFDSFNVSPNTYARRDTGSSVRLITDVK